MIQYHGLKLTYKNKQLPSITRELHVSLSICNYINKMQPNAQFWMMEKVVKITPFPYDDILLDIVWSSIKKALKK